MIISGSESGDYGDCRRKHYYRFEEELTPKKGPIAMDKGSQVHYGLEAFYSHIKEHGWSAREDAEALALYVVMTNMQKDAARVEMYRDAQRMLMNYFERYKDESFEILAVEGQYLFDVSPNLSMGFRVDLITRFTSGPFAGLIYLWDHKTAKDFWTDLMVRLNPQFPKYVAGLRSKGIKVDGVVVNQFRTRSGIVDKGKLFQRAYHTYSEHVIKERMNEFAQWAEEIKFNRLHTNGQKPPRTQNAYTCHNCFYAEVCRMELEGKDASDVKAMYFKKTSTYSYGEKY